MGEFKIILLNRYVDENCGENHYAAGVIINILYLAIL